jgi:hypothetical protein
MDESLSKAYPCMLPLTYLPKLAVLHNLSTTLPLTSLRRASSKHVACPWCRQLATMTFLAQQLLLPWPLTAAVETLIEAPAPRTRVQEYYSRHTCQQDGGQEGPLKLVSDTAVPPPAEVLAPAAI